MSLSANDGALLLLVGWIEDREASTSGYDQTHDAGAELANRLPGGAASITRGLRGLVEIVQVTQSEATRFVFVGQDSV